MMLKEHDRTQPDTGSSGCSPTKVATGITVKTVFAAVNIASTQEQTLHRGIVATDLRKHDKVLLSLYSPPKL